MEAGRHRQGSRSHEPESNRELLNQERGDVESVTANGKGMRATLGFANNGESCSEPTNGNHGDCVPAGPPVEWRGDARTVLAGKGSLRRAKIRRALACCAPFRRSQSRDGRLRREHSRNQTRFYNRRVRGLLLPPVGRHRDVSNCQSQQLRA